MTGDEIAWIIGGLAILFIVVVISLKFGDWIGFKCASWIFPNHSKAQKTSNSDINGVIIISDATFSSPYINAQLASRQITELPPNYNDVVDCCPTTINFQPSHEPPSYWNTANITEDRRPELTDAV